MTSDLYHLAGAAPAPGGVTLLTAVTVTTDVVNTAVETTAFTFSVPGGTLGTSKTLRLRIIGDFLCGTTTSTVQTRVKFGATTIFDGGIGVNVATSASRRSFDIGLDLHAKGATNLQVATAYWYLGAPGTAGTTGWPVFNNNPNFNLHWGFSGVNNGIAVDSTGAQNLVVTFQWNNAAVDNSVRVLTARLESY